MSKNWVCVLYLGTLHFTDPLYNIVQKIGRLRTVQKSEIHVCYEVFLWFVVEKASPKCWITRPNSTSCFLCWPQRMLIGLVGWSWDTRISHWTMRCNRAIQSYCLRYWLLLWLLGEFWTYFQQLSLLWLFFCCCCCWFVMINDIIIMGLKSDEL